MLFNSLPFLIFLPLVVLIYYLLPLRARWIFLLFTGYFFYGYLHPQFLILLFLSTLVDFLFALKIYNSQNINHKKIYLAVSLVFNISLLFVFKYLSMFLPDADPMIVNINKASEPVKGMIMDAVYFSIPIGISFYTFQSLSYTFDVYFGKIKPQTSFPRYAAFVAYFPQLVAGPIERYNQLSAQLFSNYKPVYKNFSNGFRLLLMGFFLKMCIADNCGTYADMVFNDYTSYNSLSLLSGITFFGLQIYADFAGYSLIALGSSICMGIELMDNFRTPYLSSSINEFWKRWHISLTSWFKDYLYIPLGGNKVGIPRWVINILLVFLVSGLWHGANYTFIIWGAIHATAYLAEHFTKPYINLSGAKYRVLKFAGGIKTFAIVTLAWVFFRAATIKDAKNIIASVFNSTQSGILQIDSKIWILLSIFLTLDIALLNNRIDKFLETKNTIFRWSLYFVLLACILMLSGTVKHPFVYFQF